MMTDPLKTLIEHLDFLDSLEVGVASAEQYQAVVTDNKARIDAARTAIAAVAEACETRRHRAATIFLVTKYGQEHRSLRWISVANSQLRAASPLFADLDQGA